MNQNLKPITHEGITYLVDAENAPPINKWCYDLDRKLFGKPNQQTMNWCEVIAQPTTGTLDGVPYYKEEEETECSCNTLSTSFDVNDCNEPCAYKTKQLRFGIEDIENALKVGFTFGREFVTIKGKNMQQTVSDYLQELRPKKRITGATTDMEVFLGEDGRNYLKVKLEYENQ